MLPTTNAAYPKQRRANIMHGIQAADKLSLHVMVCSPDAMSLPVQIHVYAVEAAHHKAYSHKGHPHHVLHV